MAEVVKQLHRNEVALSSNPVPPKKKKKKKEKIGSVTLT
jgi:hypothetical protein